MKNTNHRYYWGLCFIGMAIVLVLNEVNLLPKFFSFGSLILALIYLAIFLGGIAERSFTAVFISVGLTWVTFGKLLGLPHISLWTMAWIVAFLSIGTSFMFPRHIRRQHIPVNGPQGPGKNNGPQGPGQNCGPQSFGQGGDPQGPGSQPGMGAQPGQGNNFTFGAQEPNGFGDPRQSTDKRDWNAYEDPSRRGYYQSVHDVDENGYVQCENHLGSLAKYVKSTDLKGAFLKNSFGELNVYFDKAAIQNGPIQIQVQNRCGTIRLYFPAGWAVDQDVSVFAGEIKENNQSRSSGEPVVRLIGNVSLGNIEITYI